MITPSRALNAKVAFSAGSSLAMLCWIALSASLFVPLPIRSIIWIATAIVVPVALGIAYVVLLIKGFRDGTGGGFGSIIAVRQLFASDAALAAGWLHYLAFDLFVGMWIAREGVASAVSSLLIIPACC